MLAKFTRNKLLDYGRLFFRLSTSAPTDPQQQSAINEPKVELQLSDSCVERLRSVASSEQCLRVLVDSGGCSGFEYKFELVNRAAIDPVEDRIVERNGAAIVVDRLSLDFISGATIDFQAELIKSAFRVVDNPRAAKGCSCGVSFSLKS